MNERLYYTDAYLREFDASVTRVERVDGRTAVYLDRTAFYPTSGGQPFDVGTIAGPERAGPLGNPGGAGPQTSVGRPFQGRLQVIDVVDRDDGDIAHVLEGEGLVAGQQIHGVI